MTKKYYKEVKRKPTRDYWCPNFDGNQVEVTIIGNCPLGDTVWHRVCVWGADDLGMEMDFYGEDQEKDALTVYGKVMNFDYVDFKHLKELGFKSA